MDKLLFEEPNFNSISDKRLTVEKQKQLLKDFIPRRWLTKPEETFSSAGLAYTTNFTV